MICPHCEEPITGPAHCIPHFDGTRATVLPYHRECALRMVIGGLNHILGRCVCCGGTAPPDPPEMTRRQAAVAAVSAWKERQPPSREDTARKIITGWLKQYGGDLFGPGALASVLMTIARVATDMAEAEIAKLPDPET